VDELVAPKRRAEADGLHGEKLLRWLAADGARVRRPIVVTGSKVTLGFTESAREELEGAL
jgi:arsenate reductase-like glutaredoxin family protein